MRGVTFDEFLISVCSSFGSWRKVCPLDASFQWTKDRTILELGWLLTLEVDIWLEVFKERLLAYFIKRHSLIQIWVERDLRQAWRGKMREVCHQQLLLDVIQLDITTFLKTLTDNCFRLPIECHLSVNIH